jgi:hypothetical protein
MADKCNETPENSSKKSHTAHARERERERERERVLLDYNQIASVSFYGEISDPKKIQCQKGVQKKICLGKK